MKKGMADKVGSIFEELTFDTTALYFPLIFMLRRVVFAYLAIFWRHAIGQIIVNYIITMMAVIFLIVVKPYAETFRLKMEIFNELITFTLIVLLQFFLGTIYNPDE